jgi:hypothetical protein
MRQEACVSVSWKGGSLGNGKEEMINDYWRMKNAE